MYERYLWPFNRVVLSQVDRSKALFFNMFYVLWLISHILWPVKRDYLIEYILVLIYCHSHNNNRLGTFRIIFFYASRFYYPNHVFDNSDRITIHGRFIKLNMHRNNKMIKQCFIIYIEYKIRIQCIRPRDYTNNLPLALVPIGHNPKTEGPNMTLMFWPS